MGWGPGHSGLPLLMAFIAMAFVSPKLCAAAAVHSSILSLGKAEFIADTWRHTQSGCRDAARCADTK